MREQATPAMETAQGHVIVCGLDELGLNTLEELRRLGEDVVIVADRADESFVAAAHALGAAVVRGSYTDERVLVQAGIHRALALVIVETEDVGNLHAALAAQELNPSVRIVVRMFNQDLGRRLEDLFADCHVLSSSAIAAPVFVSAALHHDWDQRIEVAGRVLTVHEGSAREPHVILPLACVEPDGTTTLFPEEGEDLLCLVDGDLSQRPEAEERRRLAETQSGIARTRRRGAAGMAGSLWSLLRADLRLRWLLMLLLALAAMSVLIFYVFTDLGLVNSIYFTVTVISTTGFGDINLRDAPAALKLYGAALMLVGAAVLTIFYVFVTDAIVSARVGRIGAVIDPELRDHIVVCGVGSVGYRVIEEIVRAGVSVVAVELDEESTFLPPVRSLGVPTLIGDAKLTETLAELNVERARCVVAATDDDVANLETALNAQALNPDLRVVVRIFDPDLAARVERAFDIHTCRSVAALAAPTFAIAAIGERVLATTSVGTGVLVFAQMDIEVDSPLAGAAISTLEGGPEGRVVLLTRGTQRTWRPSRETVLAVGDELVVVATRPGLARMLEDAETASTGSRS